jgi:ADP-ribose pyrophosphatase YjhB (NUDIX family)
MAFLFLSAKRGENFMTMVCFDVEGTRFNYRVAGIAIRDNQVLLNRFGDHDYWFLPGGRVEMGETSREGLQREMQEELQAEVRVGQLLWIVESFFDGVEDKTYHELGLYYQMDLAPESPVYRAKGPLSAMDGHTRITFQWFSLAELDQITLYPPFLVEGLQNVPKQTVHVLDGRESD